MLQAVGMWGLGLWLNNIDPAKEILQPSPASVAPKFIWKVQARVHPVLSVLLEVRLEHGFSPVNYLWTQCGPPSATKSAMGHGRFGQAGAYFRRSASPDMETAQCDLSQKQSNHAAKIGCLSSGNLSGTVSGLVKTLCK